MNLNNFGVPRLGKMFLYGKSKIIDNLKLVKSLARHNFIKIRIPAYTKRSGPNNVLGFRIDQIVIYNQIFVKVRRATIQARV